MKVLSVDIGILNLGLIGATVENNEIKKINFCNSINITVCPLKELGWECKLNHDKTVSNYAEHLFNLHSWFDDADTIIIERQPLIGIKSLEELILFKYNDKCTLIHPTKVHKYFGYNNLDYKKRKLKSIEMANNYLSEFSIYRECERKHDISDALVQLLWWIKNEYGNEINPFERFLYKYKNTNNTNKN